MDTDPNIPTFFADPEGALVIICPACGFSKTLDSRKIRIPSNPIKTKCPCGHVFSFKLELRQDFRKPVDLIGICEHLSDRGVIQIRDLSMGGIGFTLKPPMTLKEGDNIRLLFKLDNAQKTSLIRQATVKFVSGNQVGANFTGAWFDKDFAFYMRER